MRTFFGDTPLFSILFFIFLHDRMETYFKANKPFIFSLGFFNSRDKSGQQKKTIKADF